MRTSTSQSTLARLLRDQAKACTALGSPLYAQLLRRAVEDAEAGGPTWEVLQDHVADPPDSMLALRLMGAVRDDRTRIERGIGSGDNSAVTRPLALQESSKTRSLAGRNGVDPNAQPEIRQSEYGWHRIRRQSARQEPVGSFHSPDCICSSWARTPGRSPTRNRPDPRTALDRGGTHFAVV
jgi:hypothetical protein